MNKLYLLSTALLFIATGVSHASTITLNTGVDTFNGMLLEGGNNPNVGVIFFHGRKSDRDGDVVRHLRKSLNTDGYTTFSIDNPVPVGGISTDNYRANESTIENRVYSYFNAAVDWLVASNSNIDTIILGGWSLGSRFALATAAASEQGLISINPNVTLGGLLLLSTRTTIGDTDPTTAGNINIFDTANNLGLISSLPVLDLYGDLDSKSTSSAEDRLNGYFGNPLNYTQLALGCPDFNSGGFFARNNGAAVAYTEDNCHQLRNAYSTESDAENKINPSVVLRGDANAPLESAVSSWAANNVPITTVPIPSAVWLFGTGLFSLISLARRKHQ